jgi:hypothetical protein
MRFLVAAAMIAAAAVIAVAIGAAVCPAASTGTLPRDGAVVLELFTAQGCSSCPPADRVLSSLGEDETLRGRVVPLAFHVDYWDRIGWTDPFGSPRWSARQEAYGRRFRLDGVYTPQLVLDGRAEMNGSQEARIRTEIARRLERPPVARVDLAATPGESAAEAVVTVGAELLEAREGKLDLLLAVFENGVVTAVARGENEGAVLRNDFVVRRLETVLSLTGRAGTRQTREMRVKLDGAWRPERLGVAAFLQDPRSLEIVGAAAKPLR